MMWINTQDQYPGRCLNYRSALQYTNYESFSKRCLDYEGHDSACTFEQDLSPASSSASITLKSTTSPEPWVSPLKY